MYLHKKHRLILHSSHIVKTYILYRLHVPCKRPRLQPFLTLPLYWCRLFYKQQFLHTSYPILFSGVQYSIVPVYCNLLHCLFYGYLEWSWFFMIIIKTKMNIFWHNHLRTCASVCVAYLFRNPSRN